MGTFVLVTLLSLDMFDLFSKELTLRILFKNFKNLLRT